MQDVFSVIVLCYRHFEFLYEAIDSVLIQNYPRIELIISDDGSTDFPRTEVEDYIENYKRKNIIRVIVRQESENCGTVKHLNHAVKLCTGEFIVALAGDDVLAERSVLSKYRNGFVNAGADCLIEMAQTGMYDVKLRTLESYYLKGNVRKALEQTTENTDLLLQQLLRFGPCLPATSTCFKKKFFSSFGAFDEHYQLVEDYPMHIRLAKEGWVIHYENFVAVKHRHGGISHGQYGTLTQSSIVYYEDMQKMINELILNNMDQLLPEQAKPVIDYRKKELRWIDYHLARKKHDYWSVLKIILQSPFLSIRMGLEWMYPIANRLKKIPLLLSIILWLMVSDVNDMFSEIMTLFGMAQVCNFQEILYAIAIGIFFFWLAMFIIWAICKIIWQLERFPVESIQVG
ncbi:MAG: glycosyltransferase [Anaerotruncus sp.]|nr:glycosyltransferase [Anaerotruncus sp.]